MLLFIVFTPLIISDSKDSRMVHISFPILDKIKKGSVTECAKQQIVSTA